MGIHIDYYKNEREYEPRKKRCELTDLLVRDCAHCKGDTLGDEESSTIPFNGLLRKRGEIERGDRT